MSSAEECSELTLLVLLILKILDYLGEEPALPRREWLRHCDVVVKLRISK